MLVIRSAQLTAFEDAARRCFEDEMVAHSQAFSPRLCAVIGEEQLRIALRAAIAKAEGFGFTNRGPIRLYIELMFLCGSHFDTDPQFTQIREILASAEDQMQRAERIHEISGEYLASVFGPRNANVRSALERLLLLARRHSEMVEPFAEAMVAEMTAIYPEKVAYAGQARLVAVIDEASELATRYEFDSPRARTLLVALMFAFGHGCYRDPLYPWIERTLLDPAIVSPSARSARLEKKSITWLEHVLGRTSGAEA